MSELRFTPVGDWAEHAACKGQTVLFFPKPGDMKTTTRAQQICKMCPVKKECLDHSVHNPERYGIRAGLGPKGITRERIKRGISVSLADPNEPHGTNAKYVRGCRCDECRAANRNYTNNWKKGRQQK